MSKFGGGLIKGPHGERYAGLARRYVDRSSVVRGDGRSRPRATEPSHGVVAAASHPGALVRGCCGNELRQAQADSAELWLMKIEVPQYAIQDEVWVDPAKTALVVVDMQNDFVKRGGSLLVPDAEATVPAIGRLLKARPPKRDSCRLQPGHSSSR